MIAALYLRVSTSAQAGEGKESLGTQERDLRALAKQLGLKVLEPAFQDVLSGAGKTRPGFELMLDAARRHRFTDLLVWDLTRFARSAVTGLQAVEALHASGVTVRDRQGRSSRDKLVFTILSAVAEYEREAIAERTSVNRRMMAPQGRLPSGPAPYGLRLDSDRRLLLDKTEAKWLREAAKRIVKGATTGEVANWLNGMQAPSPTRRPSVKWTYATLRHVLLEERLSSGSLMWGGVAIPAPAVLTAAEATNLRAALIERSPGRQRNRRRYPLSGLVTCSCGAVLSALGRYNDPDPDARYYGCSNWSRSAATCSWTGPRAFEALALEEAIGEVVASIPMTDRIPEPDAEPPDALADTRRARGRLQKELAGLLRRRETAAVKASLSIAIAEATAELEALIEGEANLVQTAAKRVTSSARLKALSAGLGKPSGIDFSAVGMSATLQALGGTDYQATVTVGGWVERVFLQERADGRKHNGQ